MEQAVKRPRVIGVGGNIGSGKSTFTQLAASASAKQGVEATTLESGILVTKVANHWRQVMPFTEMLRNRADAIAYANAWLDSLPTIAEEDTEKQIPADSLHILEDVFYEESLESQSTTDFLEYIKQVVDDPSLAWPNLINQANKSRHRPLLKWLGGYLRTPERGGEGIWFDQLVKDAQASMVRGIGHIGIDGVRFGGDELRTRRIGGTIVGITRPGVGSDGHLTEQSAAEVKPDIIVVNNGTLHQLGQVATRTMQVIDSHQINYANPQPLIFKSTAES